MSWRIIIGISPQHIKDIVEERKDYIDERCSHHTAEVIPEQILEGSKNGPITDLLVILVPLHCIPRHTEVN